MTGGQLLAIVLGGIATYAIRSSFLAFAGRMTELPHRVLVVLRMIPPAALAALVLPALLRPDGGAFAPFTPLVAGGLVAFAVALWKESLFLPLAAGLAAVVALQQLA